MPRILCGGPVSEDAPVFSAHVEALKKQCCEMGYKGIDNSPSPLDAPTGFKSVQWRREDSLGEYKQLPVRWSRRLLYKMCEWREEMRLAALADGYDYLFMVDSDLVLDPHVLESLLAADKPIISGIVWTQWRPWRELRWVNVFDIKDGKHADIGWRRKRLLSRGGIHQCEMTGACTLLTRSALESISYAQRGNLGEDMSMALSARDAGIPLHIHAGVKIEHRRRR